jgi:CHAT domain-containing protein
VENPQTSFHDAQQALQRGDLVRAQDEAEDGSRRYLATSPEWARKFRILDAEVVLVRGNDYRQVLSLLDAEPDSQAARDSVIKVFALKGVALARLQEFDKADLNLREAEFLCKASQEVTCGEVLRARGILLLQQAQPAKAKALFEQTAAFAHLHGDRFLEGTTLLNLGLGALREQHFDEAIDWTDAAYQTSSALGARVVAEKALGNLGWAYYYLGDSEKSLERSLEAEKLATQAGANTDRLTWITAAGYVYASRGDLAGATRSYREALDLANKTGGTEAIYDAHRALALVSVESGELDQARKHSDDASAIAYANKNRLDELYPLLVKGLIAVRSHDGAEAERILREVEQDPIASASLKWRSEHSLARLYEDEGRSDASDREYRSALATFEAARSSLQRNDSKLPFLNNAARIYDDYVHFLVARGKTDDALRWADYSRARTLTEGLGSLAKGRSAGPPPLNPKPIARRAGATVLFYWLGEKQSYLWAITPLKTRLFTLAPGPEIEATVERYRNALGGPQDVLESSDQDGRWLYRTLIAPAQELLPADAKVIVIPDGKLNSLNFETLLVSGSTPHYWIEDATIVSANSLRVLAAQSAGKPRTDKLYSDKEKSARSLLLFGNAVAPSPQYPELPNAAAEMTSIAKHFPAARLRVFQREQATATAYLASNPEQFSYIHFVAHGMASRLSPLDSAIVLSKELPKDSGNETFKLYARDIIQHRLRAELVTISACYGAGTRVYSGEGLVGLSWAFLRAGAHNVIAALWEASDNSTEQLMDKFYDELDRGESPDRALRTAKLSLLHSNSAFRKAFYWAPFQLYAGS